jgi:thioredoxin reductase
MADPVHIDHDAVVVGGGPAGLSAAMWLARYRRSVLLLDAGEHRNASTELVHGYAGHDPIAPSALLDRIRGELAAYERVRIERARADAVDGDVMSGFTVRAGNDAVRALRVVLATGVEDALPDIDGILEHYGAGVFHCPSCDGYDARGERVVVLGWGEHVAGFAATMLDWASSVVVVTGGRPLEADDDHRFRLAALGIPVLEDRAVGMLGRRGELEGVRLEGGDVVPARIAFFSVAHRPRTQLGVRLGCGVVEGDGYLDTDRRGQTTVEGVYAAGDVTPGMQLVQVAAGEGAVAGIEAAMSLRGQRGAPDSPIPAPAS